MYIRYLKIDMDFMFAWQVQYLIHSLRLLLKWDKKGFRKFDIFYFLTIYQQLHTIQTNIL